MFPVVPATLVLLMSLVLLTDVPVAVVLLVMLVPVVLVALVLLLPVVLIVDVPVAVALLVALVLAPVPLRVVLLVALVRVALRVVRVAVTCLISGSATTSEDVLNSMHSEWILSCIDDVKSATVVDEIEHLLVGVQFAIWVVIAWI